MLLELLEKHIAPQVRAALDEDIGSGDITAALIPASAQARATVISRERGILCGCAWFDAVFGELDNSIRIDWSANEGEHVSRDDTLCKLSGNARALLTGERTALNFLQTLSGTATLARRYADEVAGTPAKVLDTRKTIPGLRFAQKYAVRTGGCHNHRTGLYDGILIKENHILTAGGIAQAVEQAREMNTGVAVEIEVESIDELEAALQAGADIILLDNFSTTALVEAVALNNGRARLEASGGITLDNVARIAATGVDRISIGELTKNLRALDLSMRFQFDE